MHRLDVVTTEDVLTFLGAATTETRQREFYSTGSTGMPLAFLHEYVRVNYRELYAGTLALRINDLNATTVVENLLAHPDGTTPETRRREGRLIAARLRRTPPQRVYRMWERLCRAGRGNRRLRAVAQQWLDGRDPAFDAVKYRRTMWLVVRHLHLRVPKEVAVVLAGRWRERASFESPLLDTWRRAHYARSALSELPFTVAEGLAASRGVDRDTLLRTARLTSAERLRLAGTAERAGLDGFARLDTAPLTRLAAYVLSLDVAERERRRDELDHALRASAARAAGTDAGTWGHVAAVLDDSFSSSGSTVKRQRPLVVAVATWYLLDALAAAFAPIWISGARDPLLARPRGATDLANPILDALGTAPDWLVVVSDSVDTSPPGAASEVLRVWSERIDDGTTQVVHLNPVFDPDRYEVRRLTPAVPTLGIRDAEDLRLLVELARFASGRATREEIADYLAAKAARYVGDPA